VGVWDSVIPGLLQRYSADRIELNFEYFRKIAPRVDHDGAFLTKAIREGYVLPSSKSDRSVSSSKPSESSGLNSVSDTARISPGDRVGQARMKALIDAGLASKEDFTRSLSRDSNETQYFYRLE
jgi:hypothetical protein